MALACFFIIIFFFVFTVVIQRINKVPKILSLKDAILRYLFIFSLEIISIVLTIVCKRLSLMPFYSDFPTRIAGVWFVLHLIIYIISRRNFRSVVKDEILYKKSKDYETANSIIDGLSSIFNFFIYFYYILFIIMLFVVPICIYEGEESAWGWIHVIPLL